MKVLKFTLSGRTAFFKKPEVNSYFYFTYGNIHKVALLGIFGAILGFGGYNQMKPITQLKNKKKPVDDEKKYPEFYEKLKDIKVSVVPNNNKGIIAKKVQIFNNSVGYASKELGGNLIVKEQWLENPSWDIYILIDCKESEAIMEHLLSHTTIYQPYLGKNDHFADITNVEIIEAKECNDEYKKIDSLFPNRNIRILFEEEEELEEEDDEDFKYEEQLPIALDEVTNMYILEPFVFTNMAIESSGKVNLYNVKGKNIVFY